MIVMASMMKILITYMSIAWNIIASSFVVVVVVDDDDDDFAFALLEQAVVFPSLLPLFLLFVDVDDAFHFDYCYHQW